MSEPDDDCANEDALENLVKAKQRLRERSVELFMTIHAIQRRHRTPTQIRAIIDRSRRLIYRSLLIQRRIEHLSRVH